MGFFKKNYIGYLNARNARVDLFNVRKTPKALGSQMQADSLQLAL